jgi:Zn-dependent protease with chaperone function
MTLLDDTVRVCPQCGSDPGHDDVCRTCGSDLAGLAELPTRSQWLPEPQARSSRRRAARKSVSSAVTPSLRPLLHPTETSRLILALAAATLTLAFVLFAAIAAHAASVLPLLGGFLFFIVFLAASLWFGQQLLRARLLGQSVKVGADSLPQIHELIEEVKATLHYRRRVDVYVSDKQETPIITTSYLGTRTLVLEGDFIAGLLEADKRPQLVFLIGRAIGALRAKHLRLTFVVLLLQGLDILKFPAPFILPWYRAITYSGDQIGMMCCGDAEAALTATRRLLVGKELAEEMQAREVLPQVCLVRRNLLPRFVQLFQAEPHTTNRYANLLCFVRYHDPELWQRLRVVMPVREAQLLEDLWSRSPHRKRMSQVSG